MNHTLGSFSSKFRPALALVVLVACSVHSAPEDKGGASAGSVGNPSAGTGGAMSAQICQQLTDCEDCKDFRCGREVLGCTNAACEAALAALNPCFKKACDFEACTVELQAAGPEPAKLAACLRQQCADRCAGLVRPPEATGGSGGSGGSGASGASGGSGGSATQPSSAGAGGPGPLHECPALTEGCGAALDKSCGTPINACLSEPTCSEALDALNDCLNASCQPDCWSTFQAASGAAKLLSDCIVATPGCAQ